jgi:hypothetical protein
MIMSDAINTPTEKIIELTRDAVKRAKSYRAFAAQLSRYTPVTYGSIGNWMTSRSLPDPEKMEIITLKAPADSDEYKFAAAVLEAMRDE